MNVNDLLNLDFKTNVSGIYSIICKSNGKCYIGKSKNIERRWAQHRGNLKKNKHHCQPLQNSWNKYGKDSFIFRVLENCPIEVLGEKEILWASKFDKTILLNVGFMDGVDSIFTEEKKKKLSKKLKSKWKDPTFKERMSKSLKGHEGWKPSKKQKEAISNKLMGKSLSVTTKKKIISSRKRKLTKRQANQIRLNYCKGASIKKLSEIYKVSLHVVSNIIRGASYILDCDKDLIEKAKSK